MKIETGKYYRNVLGEVHGPMRVTKQYPDRFTDELGSWYGEDGHYWAQRPDCPFSLIELVPPGATP
jgi:hypothetical protein